MKKLSILFLVATLASCTTKVTMPQAETRTITVSNDSIAEDMLQFSFDDKGLDVAVHFAFDEDENTLTVSLVPSRPIYTFHEDTQYKKTFKRCFPMFPRKKFHPEKLSYPILLPPSTTVRIRQHTKKDWRSPKSKHIFNKWIEASEGLEPFCQEYKLLNDSIEQGYKMTSDLTKVSFKLRNIFALDLTSKPAKENKTYKLTFDKDINLTYNVIIQRNPCFGTEEAQNAAMIRFEDVCKEFNKFRATYPSGIVNTTEQSDLFNQYKSYLLSRFPKINETSKCSDLQYTYDEYNLYVDSISSLPCKLIPIEKDEDGNIKTGIDPAQMIANARKIDELVNNYLISTDVVEKRDIVITINSIIKNCKLSITKKGVINSDQQKAVSLFKKAELYYNTNIKL